MKYTSDSHDSYVDVASGCLKNRFNIVNLDYLKRIESTFTCFRADKLYNDPILGKFDFSYIKKIHHYLFQDIYDWAGEPRTLDISKGETRFAHHGVLEQAGTQLFTQLTRETHLKGLETQVFAERAGYYLGEFNVFHPFREGNGRTQRAFIEILAIQTGYFIEWEKVSSEEMIQASIKAYHGNAEHMSSLILTNLISWDQAK